LHAWTNDYQPDVAYYISYLSFLLEILFLHSAHLAPLVISWAFPLVIPFTPSLSLTFLIKIIRRRRLFMFYHVYTWWLTMAPIRIVMTYIEMTARGLLAVSTRRRGGR
jgi:hypothetical protein